MASVNHEYHNPQTFWIENGQRIRIFREILERPATGVGEKILNKVKMVGQSPVLKANPRLYPIMGSLIALSEAQAVSSDERLYILSNKTTQRAAVHALSMKVEDDIKRSYWKGEPKGYYDYQRFLNDFIKRCNGLDSGIEKDGKHMDIVGELFNVFNEAVRGTIKGGMNFSFNKEIVYEAVLKDMPEFKKVNGGIDYRILLKRLSDFYHFISPA